MGKKRLKWRIAKLFALGFLLVLVVLVINTLLVSSKQVNPIKGNAIVPMPGFAQRLSGAIQFATINHYQPSLDTAVFARFHAYLRQSFPTVFKTAQLTNFEQHALLLFIKGSQPAKKPLVLLAHQDVVPVDSSQWLFPAFKGLIDQTYIAGRGTLDDKGSLMALLESLELLLNQGFQPKRSLYLAFGGDEELDGRGAAAIAAWMRKNKLQPEMILDEGLVITHGMVPMIDKPVALIGTAEKGYASIKLSITLPGGHSSAPGKETAITVLSAAVLKATQELPQTRICQAVDDFMDHLCPETEWPVRIVFANRWLFKPIITSVYKSTPSGSALVSTTAAATVFNAGTTDNVLPSEASAIINSRLLPGETTQELLNRLRKLLNDPRIKLEFVSTRIDPSPVSPIDNEAFKTLATTVRQAFPEVLVMPNLLIATSDSRHYAEVCPNIYKFAPYNLSSADLEGIHGTNERIKISDYANMISFYARLIQNFDSDLK